MCLVLQLLISSISKKIMQIKKVVENEQPFTKILMYKNRRSQKVWSEV